MMVVALVAVYLLKMVFFSVTKVLKMVLREKLAFGFLLELLLRGTQAS